MVNNMTNGQKFSNLYNLLDQAFSKNLGQSEHVAFSQKIRNLVQKNPVVGRYKDDHQQMGSLRNEIVNQSKNGFPIAEPRTETVDLTFHTLKEFQNPSRVTPTFQFKVFSVTSDTPLFDLLSEMKRMDFSQAPEIDE